MLSKNRHGVKINQTITTESKIVPYWMVVEIGYGTMLVAVWIIYIGFVNSVSTI